MFPYFQSWSEHFRKEIKIQLVFESGEDLNRWHLLLKMLLHFIQRMLLHQNVILSFHTCNLLNLTNFQSKELIFEFVVLNLEDFSEVSIP